MKKLLNKKLLASVLCLAMISVFWYFPPPKGAGAVDSIIDAKDTISDSDLGVSANHVFTFTTSTTTPDTGYIEIEFPDAPQTFGAVTSIGFDCPSAGTWASSSIDAHTIRCTAGADNAAAANTITVYSLENPNYTNQGTQMIDIKNYSALGALVLERVTVAVVILDDVLMTATVDSSLTFNVIGTTSAVSVNGVSCTENSTATTTPFGTLESGISQTVCQDLEVTTNADDGYIVTVEQDGELTSDSNSDINSFRDAFTGYGTSTPEAWASPSNTLGEDNTYGHMGVTSNDDDTDDDLLMTNDYFTSEALYVGLEGTAPLVVMAHDGPSDGETQNYGFATIAYTAEIGSLQEAGDYESKLTYICTPTF